MIVYDAQRKPVALGASVGHGGEATVYRVEKQPGWLAKIYEPEPRPNYPGKLAWMVSHPPENPTSKLEHASLAWPEALLFDSQRRLIGYQMPHIQRAVPLLEVFNPRRRAEILPQFDRRYLLRTAHNLAAALAALHRSGYVAGDLNESNVLVTPTALVTLIDTDSFQVREEAGGKKIVYPCPVGKPEYTPPELQGKALGEIIRLPDHDSFGLAVLIFQLLMNGSHPFRAQWLAAGDPPPLEVRIANGAYPYVESPAYPVRPPKNAAPIDTLHPWLVELFRRCFVDGHLDPRWRPGPDLWARALAKAEQSMICCAQGHFYSSHLRECPYCSQMSKFPASSRPANTTRARKRWAAPPFPAPAPSRPGPAPAGTAGAAASPSGSRATRGLGGAAIFRSSNPFAGRFGFSGAAPSTGGSVAGVGTFPGRVNGLPASFPLGGVLLHPRPVIPPGAVSRWIRQRTMKSILVGGSQGALTGALPGAALGLFAWASGDMLSWGLLLGMGGALGGLLRGWKPGHKLASLIGQHIGWKLFWQGFGLLTGLIAGAMLGMIFVWAVFPVILGMILGAQGGRYLGGKIFQFGSLLGWERVWGALSALGFAAIGFGLSRLVGLAGANEFGANLSSGLLPFAANGSPTWAVTWMFAGALAGSLSGALAGILADLIGRLTGLVD